MIVIGEKLNSSIPSVYAAIEKKDSRFVSDLAVKQEEAGAHFLDINAGMFVEAEEENLRWLMNTVQAVSKLPLVIDTPDPSVALALAKEYRGEKPVINSVTLEENRFAPMVEAAKIMLMNGDLDEKLAYLYACPIEAAALIRKRPDLPWRADH